MSSTQDPRPAKRSRRADAQHNYDRLVAVARTATEQRGERISLEDVARDAGVAIGTLYNHFPTRQDLLAATFIDETDELRARAVDLTNHPAPGEALREWLHLHLQYSARGRGLGALVMSWKYVEGSDMQIAFHAMREAGEQLFDRAVDNGDVRSDVELIDLLRLIWGTELISAQAAAPPSASTRCSASSLLDFALAHLPARSSSARAGQQPAVTAGSVTFSHTRILDQHPRALRGRSGCSVGWLIPALHRQVAADLFSQLGTVEVLGD